MKKKLILISATILFFVLVILFVFKYNQKEIIFQKSNIGQINQANQEPPIINSLALSSFPETKWLSYQNDDLGITFNYPDQVIPNMYWTSYDAVNQVIRPNIVLVKDNILYIKSGEYSFDTVEAEYQKYKEENGGNFGLDPSWRITVADVNNEQELSDFIKKYYGKSCSYHKEPIAIFPDTFDIVLDGDDKSLDVTECPVNYNYYIKYSPVNKKIASWNTSQECQIGYGFEKCFDKRIAESFHFMKQTDLKICPQEVAGFKFSYPKTWGDCKVDGQKISFQTDFKKYNVDLVAEIRETSRELAKGFITYNLKQEQISGISNSIIYGNGCGGGIACDGLNIDNQKFYEINWEVVSNQPVPDNLEWIWTPDYSFTPDDIWTILRSIEVSEQNTITYQWVLADDPQYSYPQITGYANTVAMDKVNKVLAETFKDQGCNSRVAVKLASDDQLFTWNLKPAVDYAQDDIFSVSNSGGYFCGGTYPVDNYLGTLTFDMRTGEQISFENLFKDYEKDQKQIINAIYGETTAKADDYAVKHPEASDCGGINTFKNVSSNPQNYRPSTSTKTISVRSEYPHVIAGCTVDVEVPIEKLLPFVTEDSILNRIK